MRSPDVISLAEFADTTAATMATMAVVEISGRISTTFSVNFLKKWLITNPSTIGTITKTEIMRKCPDISQVTVQRALAELVEKGEVLKLGGGRYTKYTWNNES